MGSSSKLQNFVMKLKEMISGLEQEQTHLKRQFLFFFFKKTEALGNIKLRSLLHFEEKRE